MKTLNQIGREFCLHSGFSDQDQRNGLYRVAEELEEAFEATSTEELLEELADVVLTIAAVTQAWGLDLDAAVQVKHKINLERKWGPHPTIPGAVKHLKEGGK